MRKEKYNDGKGVSLSVFKDFFRGANAGRNAKVKAFLRYFFSDNNKGRNARETRMQRFYTAFLQELKFALEERDLQRVQKLINYASSHGYHEKAERWLSREQLREWTETFGEGERLVEKKLQRMRKEKDREFFGDFEEIFRVFNASEELKMPLDLKRLWKSINEVSKKRFKTIAKALISAIEEEISTAVMPWEKTSREKTSISELIPAFKKFGKFIVKRNDFGDLEDTYYSVRIYRELQWELLRWLKFVMMIPSQGISDSQEEARLRYMAGVWASQIVRPPTRWRLEANRLLEKFGDGKNEA